jgi:hypothetical protein
MTPEEIRSEIKTQMSQRHPGPSGPFWERLGAEALPVIREMYRETASSYERSWLIDGLAHFNDAQAGELLRSEAEKTENSVLKKKLLSAYVQSQGDASVSFVEPHLSSPDPHIRLALSRAIRSFVSPGIADPLLAKFKLSEKEAWVLEALDKKPSEGLRKVGRDPLQKPAGVAATEAPPSPLTDAEIAGEWKGVYVSEVRSGQAKVKLTLQDKKWKGEWFLPGSKKAKPLPEGFELHRFQSAREHWLEIRSKSEDAVFIGRKRARKKE